MQDDALEDEDEEIETLDDALVEIEKLTVKLNEFKSENNPGVWPLVIALDPPLEFGKKRPPISELRVRQPRMGDLHGIFVHPHLWTFDHMLEVGQRLTTVGDGQQCISLHALKKLPPEQGSIITNVVRVFFLKCL